MLPNVRHDHAVEDSARWGLVWGVLVYAVYDLTNLATLRDYDVGTACIDIVWGGALGFITTLCTQLTTQSLK